MSLRLRSSAVLLSLRLASRSPSTASPSRLMLSAAPDPLIRRSAGPSFPIDASITRWLTIFLSTRRAIGTTIRGSSGANTAPRPIRKRSVKGKNLGVSLRSWFRFRAATFLSSGRITPSTKPTANSRPFASCSSPASRLDAFGVGSFAASSIQF